MFVRAIVGMFATLAPAVHSDLGKSDTRKARVDRAYVAAIELRARG